MANLQGLQRSNYVRIRPEKIEEVRAYCERFDINLQKGAEDTYVLLPNDDDSGLFGTDPDNNAQFDAGKIAVCMEPDQVLVIMSVGYEAQRSLHGYAEAWSATGDVVGINLDNIYDEARNEFGKDKIITLVNL